MRFSGVVDFVTVQGGLVFAEVVFFDRGSLVFFFFDAEVAKSQLMVTLSAVAWRSG